MGTSNWQNLPYAVDTLMKIEPKRVLDIGVGYGRWGMIIREFCEVWFGRIFREDWQIHIEGVEAFPKSIDEYHRYFYDEIHIGDLREVHKTLNGPWDVVMFGDVLEHFEKETAYDLLTWALDKSTYVLVNIPIGKDWPQEDSYENEFERHLSEWEEEDFRPYSLVRLEHFRDFQGRPFAAFILSKDDPRNLREQLFSFDTKQSLSANELKAITPEGLVWRGKRIMEELKNVKGENEFLRNELNRIKSSLAYRAAAKLARSPLGPVARKMLARFRHPHPTNQGSGRLPSKVIFNEKDTAWLESVRGVTPLDVSVAYPKWRGIKRSAMELFDHHLYIDDSMDEKSAHYFAHLIKEAGCRSITLQGLPLTYRYLIEAVEQYCPETKVNVIWHGSFMQSGEPVAWEGFRLVHDMCQAGLIHKWGFVKEGMAEVMARKGLRTGFVMNCVRQIPEGPSQPLADGMNHLGFWYMHTDWRKLPYAMIASSSMIDNVCLHMSGADPRSRELAQLLDVTVELQYDAVPQEKMPEQLAKMHLNLYVSMSECAPMLPLESLSAGSPCLLGPNSHYFKDCDYLRERLVVPYPEKSYVIAQYAKRALAERDEIINRYIDYAPGYNRQAEDSLRRFLEE